MRLPIGRIANIAEIERLAAEREIELVSMAFEATPRLGDDFSEPLSPPSSRIAARIAMTPLIRLQVRHFPNSVIRVGNGGAQVAPRIDVTGAADFMDVGSVSAALRELDEVCVTRGMPLLSDRTQVRGMVQVGYDRHNPHYHSPPRYPKADEMYDNPVDLTFVTCLQGPSLLGIPEAIRGDFLPGNTSRPLVIAYLDGTKTKPASQNVNNGHGATGRAYIRPTYRWSLFNAPDDAHQLTERVMWSRVPEFLESGLVRWVDFPGEWTRKEKLRLDRDRVLTLDL